MSIQAISNGAAVVTAPSGQDCNSFLQTIKEKVIAVWELVKNFIEPATMVGFRILEVFHPYLGPKIEAAWGWVKGIWYGMKIEDLEKDVEKLTSDNKSLKAECDQLAQSKTQLTQERDLLRNQVADLQTEKESRTARIATLESDVRINATFKQDAEELQRQNGLLVQQRESSVEMNKGLQEQLRLLTLELGAVKKEKFSCGL